MDPQVSGSFIPKAPLVAVRRPVGAGVGLFFLAAALLLVLSVIGAAAVFAYQNILNARLASQDRSLKLAEGAFEPDVIEQLSRLDSRINNVETLLGKHVAPSAIFDYLSTITLVRVQFTAFTYQLNTDGSAALSLSGVGDSFSTVALQSDQFGASRLLKDVVFSDVAIGSGGKVNFSVKATLDPSLYIFSREQNATAATLNPATSSTTPTH